VPWLWNISSDILACHTCLPHALRRKWKASVVFRDNLATRHSEVFVVGSTMRGKFPLLPTYSGETSAAWWRTNKPCFVAVSGDDEACILSSLVSQSLLLSVFIAEHMKCVSRPEEGDVLREMVMNRRRRTASPRQTGGNMLAKRFAAGSMLKQRRCGGGGNAGMLAANLPAACYAEACGYRLGRRP